MYLAARSWGISPGDFWEMTPGEILLEADARSDPDPTREFAGSLTMEDIEKLSRME